MNPLVKIREELSQKRDKQITQEDLAKACGVSVNTIYALENGKVQSVNQKVLDLLDKIGYGADEFEEKYKEWLKDEQSKALHKLTGKD